MKGNLNIESFKKCLLFFFTDASSLITKSKVAFEVLFLHLKKCTEPSLSEHALLHFQDLPILGT